jgi:hypothetical protein
MPEAIDPTVGIMALVAHAEREAISRRTKEALAVAKARSVKLGNPNGAASLRRAGKGRCRAQGGGGCQCGSVCSRPHSSGGRYQGGRTYLAQGLDSRADGPRDQNATRRGLASVECERVAEESVNSGCLACDGDGVLRVYGSTAALAATLTLATGVNRIGIGFQRTR